MNSFLQFWHSYHRDAMSNSAVGLGGCWLATASIPQETLVWWVQAIQITASLVGIMVGILSAANLAATFYYKIKNKGK